jgi:CheY-like chemotaxis protein
MRLADMSPALVRRAVGIYCDQAWPPDAPVAPGAGRARAAELEGSTTLGELLGRLERAETADGALCYTLRLGNPRYPFMKFALQEYLVPGEFFFTVDTHDNLDVRPSAPDYTAWLELKRYNRGLKERIEAAWRGAGLPTFEDLRLLCEGLAPVEREERKRARLLLVDDERDVAIGLAALLRARGYEVEVAHTGEQVLEVLERDPLPDLVLLDYELPGLDGEAVLAHMRHEPRLAGVRVLMATASAVDLERLQRIRISGYLQKPYAREVLFKMLRRLLPRAPA